MTTRSDVLLLYAARGVRGFGDGFAIIILPAYLSAIGFDPVQIGFVATASLLGTALFTLGHRGDRGAPRPADLAADGRRASWRAPAGVSECRAVCLRRAGGVRRHDQSLDRRPRRAGAARARHAGARRRRPGAHPHLRALQPDRRAFDGGRRAGGGGAGLSRARRHRPAQRVQADVLRLCGARGAERSALPAFAPRADGRAARQRAARSVARHRLQAGRAVQPRRLCRRLRRAVAAGAVAVRALRSVAVGREPVLLLVEHVRARFPIRWRRGSRRASASSTPWSSRISRRASC